MNEKDLQKDESADLPAEKQESIKSRVNSEKENLDKKISNLTKFLSTEKYKELDKNHKRLLNKQLVTMSDYSNILKDRLELL